MSPKLILSRLDDLSDRIVGAAARIAEKSMREYPSTIYEKIAGVIASQVKRLALS